MSADRRTYLLLAGLLPGGAASDACPAELEDPASFLQIALDQRMLPALGQEHAIAQFSFPEELASELRTILKLNSRRNAELKFQALAATAALNRNGITPLLLKGAAAMAEDLYEVPGALITADTDVAVREEDWERSLRILLDAGFEQTAPMRWDRHHLPPLLHTATSTTLELHRWLSKKGTEGLLPLRECWSRTQAKTAAGGESFHVLDPTDALVHNIVHAQVHHVAYLCCSMRMKNLYDFALIARRYRGEIEWQRVQTGARAPLYARAARWHMALSAALFPWAEIPAISAADPFVRLKQNMSTEAQASFARQMKLLSNFIFEPSKSMRHCLQRLFSPASFRRNWCDAANLLRHARTASQRS